MLTPTTVGAAECTYVLSLLGGKSLRRCRQGRFGRAFLVAVAVPLAPLMMINELELSFR